MITKYEQGLCTDLVCKTFLVPPDLRSEQRSKLWDQQSTPGTTGTKQAGI